MTNDISKHYSVKLETKSTAKLNNNYLNFNYGDDITLSISIMDDGSPKNIDNCEVDMIIVNESRINPIIHNFSDGGITVANNVVTIVCKSGYIDMIGVNIAQLIIRNADQNISTQMFVYNTVSTLSSNDVESAIDGINTIHDIYELIDRMNSVLESVGSSTDELEGKVNDADTLVRTLVDKANTEIAGVNSIIEQAKASEDERKAAELLRIQNEDTRVSSENLRVASETTREQNELTRNTSETSRIEAELVRTNSENKRVTTENLRVEAEIKRSENEAGRVSAEQARVLEFETIKGEQESFKESVNEQILNSKTDYFGEEHLTVDKRLNEDFDKLWQFNNESQLLEYSGTNVTASDSYYGLVKDTVIKGRTLYNIADDSVTHYRTSGNSRGLTWEKLGDNGAKWTVIDNTILTYRTVRLRKQSMLKPSTIYTLMFTITKDDFNLPKEFTVSGVDDSYNGMATNQLYRGGYIVGTNVIKFTTHSDISTYTGIGFGFPAINQTKTPNGAETIIKDVMLLEGDYTSTPLSDIPYGEGIYSVGEKEVTENGKYKVKVKSCGKNLIDKSKLILGYISSDGEVKNTGVNDLLTDFIKIKPNTNYIGYSNGSSILNNYSFYDINKNFIERVSKNGHATSPNNAWYLRYHNKYVDDGSKIYLEDVKLQLEEGTVATDYEPYKETVVEYILDEPLRQTRYADIINENGLLTRNIIKIDLTEINTWTRTATLDNCDRYTWGHAENNAKYKVLPGAYGICNVIPYIRNDNTDTFHCRADGSSPYGNFSIWIPKIELQDNDMYHWIQEKKPYIIVETTEPMKTQLEKPQIFSQEGTTHISSSNLLPPTISCSIPSNVPAVVSSLRLENETLNNEVATLSLENEQLKENNDTQDEVINVSLLATDEMYNMLEPILGMTAETSMLEVGEVSKMVDLYVVMIQRGLKTIDQVPERYREEVQALLKEIEK